MTRRWWTDEVYRQELQTKIDVGWYIRIEGSQTVGQVCNVIHAGLKVRLPDGTYSNIVPESPDTENISMEQYETYAAAWSHQRQLDHAAKLQQAENERVFQATKRALQQSCQHVAVSVTRVVKVAGCDIDDTTCNECHKILRRSYSTASDRDPDDYISDWRWWLRTYAATSGTSQLPQEKDYRIVDEVPSGDYS